MAARTTIGVVINRPMTAQELAKFLQVSISTIARGVRQKQIPFIRLGTKMRFIPSDVVQKLQRGKKKK